MSFTYTDPPLRPFGEAPPVRTPPTVEAPFTPVYARSGKARRVHKRVKTWMILAPIGALVLIGGAVAMTMGTGEDARPLVEAEPIASAAPTPAPATVERALTATPSAAAPSPVIAPPAPAARRNAPAVRRIAPAAPTVAARATARAPVAATPVEPTGPRPYSDNPTATAPTMSSTVPVPTPLPVTPRAPTIAVEPLG